MKKYIRSSSDEYFFWIFRDTEDKFALYKGRASSLRQCRDMLDYYKQTYSDSCVITIKTLGREDWICTRANTV